MDIIVFIVVALIVLGIVGLVAGVANDAINFLNSAIGSHAAPRLVVMAVASAGMIAGVLFSSGMMEIARKGIFNPGFFTLEQIMLIFLAVMIANVLLLDFFNTFGLPTSTTVSIVFGLLGGSLAIAGIIINGQGRDVFEAFEAINAPSVLKILTGILLSVVIAFIAGSLTQYFTRMVFTFDYVKRMRRYGAVYGALIITAILFFIIIKGVKGAAFLSAETTAWILDNAWLLAVYSFVFWTAVLQATLMFTKANIFKPIVLMGTFALSMAFAANDLVNFIGAPLAGISAYSLSLNHPDPLNMVMSALNESVSANTWYLLASGIIMVVTLALNKKARTVARTEINLGRQSEGSERFESIAPARGIVRAVLVVFNLVERITPASVRARIGARFDQTKVILEKGEDGSDSSFDLVRAAVNLMVAAILISIGTTLKLPLSTTYVTFTVAMATALSDRAWGRESAVYRVSGVLTVIGGWFLTAFFAAATAGFVAIVIYYGGLAAMIGMVGLSAFLIYRSTSFHKRREKEIATEEAAHLAEGNTPGQAKEMLLTGMGGYVISAGTAVKLNTEGLFAEDRTILREAKRIAKTMDKQCKAMTSRFIYTRRMEDEESEFAQPLANALGALQRLASMVKNLTYQSYVHIDNNHNVFNDLQAEEMRQLDEKLQRILSLAGELLGEGKNISLDDIHAEVTALKDLSRKFDKNQLKRTKREKYPSRTSLLFFEILSDTNGIVDNLLILLHATQAFTPQESAAPVAPEFVPVSEN